MQAPQSPDKSELPQAIRDLAESPTAGMPLAPGDRRFVLPDAVVWLGDGGSHPELTVVLRLRLGTNLEERVGEIRRLLRAHGRAQATWEIGPSAEPGDLEARLIALGMVPYEEPVGVGMVLRRPLPAFTSRVVVRPAETLDDAVLVSEVLNAVFRERSESPAERRARLARTFTAYRETGRVAFLATLDDRPIAAAHAIYTDDAVILCGGATLPEARGLGAYRALVAARYAEAVRRGTPTLVVQAGVMSRPILEQLGFEPVAEVHVLLDSA
jgi:GNAT superfamily N-acetyltransferase